MNHILSTKQFNRESILAILERAKEMESIIESGGSEMMKGKIMATLFFEPSTRTRFSFEAAMYKLGGNVISNADMMVTSSVKKQETLFDTGKVVSQMADIIVMRHPEVGSVVKLSEGSDVPVINAGDGSAEHPSQGLLDIYTIWKEKGTLDGLTVGMVGDLKYGRVPHSQCDLLKHFDVKFVFVSPEELAMPRDILDDVRGQHREVKIGNNLEEMIGGMDVVSMTRIQEERFASKEEYQKYAGLYVLDDSMMNFVKEDAIVIHPLPRVNEIALSVDQDDRAKYFDQVGNGVVLRMALISSVL